MAKKDTDLIRLMHSLFLPAAGELQRAAWQPSADVYQTRDGWLVKFDLAGVRPDDLTLTIEGRRLTVRGTRRDWSTEQDCCCYRMEISYSRFERTVELPGDLELARIATDYQYGMLLVRIQTEGAKRGETP
jgi:HSP20 family protein